MKTITLKFVSYKKFKYVYFEGRKSRISFFDNTITGGSKRVGRIELRRNNPDILLLTDRCDNNKTLISKIIVPNIHDKGSHMRRFRIADSKQAVKFGELFTKIIMESEK